MPRYRILFYGHEFNIPADDVDTEGDNIIGFITTRFVNAANERKASEYGLINLKSEKEVKKLIEISKKTTEKTPIIEIDEIEKVPFYKGMFSQIGGFTFYSKDE